MGQGRSQKISRKPCTCLDRFGRRLAGRFQNAVSLFEAQSSSANQHLQGSVPRLQPVPGLRIWWSRTRPVPGILSSQACGALISYEKRIEISPTLTACERFHDNTTSASSCHHIHFFSSFPAHRSDCIPHSLSYHFYRSNLRRNALVLTIQPV